jgi:aldose 1-epimerase
LTDNNELVISYDAETDKPTVCNLTQHTYFNLDGHNSGDVLNHKMLINADYFTPTDADSIPTGEIKDVVGTNFDFKVPTEIGARINNENEQLIFAGGYDHNWCLNKNEENELSLAATTFASESGIKMDTLTTEPGVQFYTGNYLDGKIIGKDGAAYNRRNGFCLETQHYPDSPNHSNFPSTVLNPGEKYLTKTVYKFYN